MRIEALNERYGPAPSGRRFLLLHRRRLWNDSEGKWMGWERKRGKLNELNRLLRGATDTSFVAGPDSMPAGVRYVIVLDGDTRLPRGAARRLIGKMAHPMNQPVADRTGRVIDGYGVLQPRVTPLLPCDGEGSLYQWAFSNGGGMDPYSFAVSDLYQDMCGEGSYCGKGIYDVDAFEAALRGRIPENTLLSHDLLEGIFARAGLASDIEVIDAFPARMDVAASRQMRWARGDWQLLPWLASWQKRAIDDTPVSDMKRAGVSLIGRWKMLDNLRRTLSAPGAFLALMLGWRLLPAHPLRWTGFILCSLTIAALLPAAASIIPRRWGLSKRMHLYAVLANMCLAAVQVILLLAFLPYQAWIMGEAIVRTLYRLLVSHRHLLEWVTAEHAQARPLLNMAASYQRMFGGIVLAGAAALLLIGANGATRMVAAPFLVLWLLAPAIAWRISQTEAAEMRPATPAQDQALRLIARRTWRFFETFVTADDNMLPPDNFQEDPKPVIAHRTSPTNIGLYLLSVTAAADLGWISVANAAERLEATLATTQRLHRHRGHLLNWYDTQDLRPLEPAYVSAVDSGNLAGHLIAVWNFCEEAAASADWRGGITDALLLLRQALGNETRLDSVITAIGEEIGLGSKQFFFAKKNQKTFSTWHPFVDATAAKLTKVFCFFFSKKKTLPVDVNQTPHLESIARLAEDLVSQARETQNQEAIIWADAVRATAQAHLQKPDEAALTARLHAIAASARALFDGMAFAFLFNEGRGLLAVGHRVADGTLEDNCYDLLASEARLASFVAIAKGDLPTRHWFRLGRPMVAPDANAALVSWSGSMFEYLMPSLVMRAPAASLMAATNRHMLREQMRYGARSAACRGAPRNPPMRRAIWNIRINIPASASPASR